MNWIDEFMENEKNREPTLADALNLTRAHVWHYLDGLLEQLHEPLLVHSYGLDMMLDNLHAQALLRGRTRPTYEYTYCHFADEWLEQYLDDGEELEDMV